MFKKVYISLGTNLGNKGQNLSDALIQIENHCGTIVQKSSIYSSKPWGYQSFNNYLNQVVEIESNFNPEQLLRNLLQIEKEMGRMRNNKELSDRIIDLDILFFSNQILKTEDLSIPHPNLHKRNFILQPMLELDDNFLHPTLGKTIKELATLSEDQNPVTIV